MTKLMEKPNYKLAKIILSKNQYFTVDEVVQNLKEIGLEDVDINDVKTVLKKYRDNGLVIEYDSAYSLTSFAQS